VDTSPKKGEIACLAKPVDVQQILEVFKLPIAMSARADRS
jgi:hypothetical protein